MKKLITVLFLASLSSAHAEDKTICRVVLAGAPIESVTIYWGEQLPFKGPSVFRATQQKIEVVVTGPQLEEKYPAVAEHRYFNTRVGGRQSMVAQLNESSQLYIEKNYLYIDGRESVLKSAGISLQQGTPNEQSYKLDCP